MLEYKGHRIEDIIIDYSNWDSSEIEITIVTDKIIFKNIYVPYFPKIHDQLIGKSAPFHNKMKAFWEEIFERIDKLEDNINSAENIIK